MVRLRRLQLMWSYIIVYYGMLCEARIGWDVHGNGEDWDPMGFPWECE